MRKSILKDISHQVNVLGHEKGLDAKIKTTTIGGLK